MKKYKFFSYNLKKEEEWIQGIIEKGYRLRRVGAFGGYEFELTGKVACMPIVRIDFRIFKKKEEYRDYIAMFEDSGWKHISGSMHCGSQYFEKRKPDASDEIFSDQESKAGRYKRIADNWMSVMCSYLPLVVVFIATGVIKIDTIFHLKELYYTPGLWEMSGFHFWRAFLFETPFAFMRGFAGWLLIAFVLLYAYFGLKASYWYRKEKSVLEHK